MNEDLRFFGATKGKTPFYVTLAGVTHPDPNYHITRSSSRVAVMEYVVEGEGYVWGNGKRVHVEKDTVYLLLCGFDHDYYSDAENPFRKIFLNVSGEDCMNLIRSYGLADRNFFDGRGLLPLFERIPRLIAEERDEIEIQGALQGLFVELLSRLSLAGSESEHSEEALALKHYLDLHPERTVTAEELAATVFRSRDYCQKLFRREFGVTPYAYQLNQRMQKAKTLLADTHLSVGEIAEVLGYSDLHYFSNLFVQKCGCRPLAYRKAKR